MPSWPPIQDAAFLFFHPLVGNSEYTKIWSKRNGNERRELMVNFYADPDIL